MNVKSKVLSAGALFFLGHLVFAQNDTIPNNENVQEIEAVVIQGYRTVTKTKAVISTAQISSETINNRPNSNLLNVAQGQLAGVNIATGTGQPGSTPTVTIRGKGSLLGNNEPLYVIDGFPGTSESFRNINPNEVESMEVLKDASAIAQYGNRGANGVIVVKTKRARFNQDVSFNYRTQYGVSVLQKHKYNLANARELLTLENRIGRGRGANMTLDQIAAYDTDTDWLNYFFQPAILQSHDISMASGSDNLNNYTNIGYLDQEGILSTTSMKRFNFRNNFVGRSSDRRFNYSVGTALSFSRNSQAGNLNTGGVNQNLALGAMKGATYLNPNEYVDGFQLYNLYQATGNLLYTPLMLIDKERTFRSSTDELRIDISTEASYKILEPLTARFRMNGTMRNLNDNVWQTPDAFNSWIFHGNLEYRGDETFANSRSFIFNNLAQLSYDNQFGDHTVSASGAFEYNSFLAQASSMRQTGLNERTWVPETGSGWIVSGVDAHLPRIGASQNRHTLAAFLADASYDYNSKYGLVATIRHDGSARFNDGYRWGTFWSIGGRWNIDRESFMNDVNFVNVLKLRGSYGTVGNERGPDGAFGNVTPRYTNTFGITTTPAYGTALGYAIAMGYPQLQWETTKTWNVGIDFELFNRSLVGQFDVYNKTTIDQFYPVGQSPVFGQTFLNRNSEIDVQNQGYELNLAWHIVRDATRNLNVTLRGNGAMNNEKVFDIPESPLISGQIVQTYSANGQAWQLPYLYHYIGVNPNNGALLYESANGTPTENPVSADRKVLDYNFRNPKYVGGFGFDASYKGFFVSTTFNFVAGIYRFDYDLSGYMDPGDLGQFTVSRDLLNAWTPDNTNTNTPSLTANLSHVGSSDRFLVESSYLRVRNLQVGYTIPRSVLRGTFVKDMTVMLQGENLYTWSKWRGFDAESNRAQDQYGYPTPRTFTLGIDVKF